MLDILITPDVPVVTQEEWPLIRIIHCNFKHVELAEWSEPDDYDIIDHFSTQNPMKYTIECFD